MTRKVTDEKINALLCEPDVVLGALGLRVVALEQCMSRTTSALFSLRVTVWRLYRESWFFQLGGPSNRKLGTKSAKRDTECRDPGMRRICPGHKHEIIVEVPVLTAMSKERMEWS